MMFEVVPHLEVKGIAPDGREFDLSMIWAEWLGTITAKEQSQIMDSSIMEEPFVRSFWEWSGWTDPQPKSLAIYLRVNPEFADWTLLATVHVFVCHKLGGESNRKMVEDALVRAFANGQILTRGDRVDDVDENGHLIIVMHNIELRTRDVVKWLRLEFDIKVTKYEIACYPRDSSVLEMLSRPRPRK